MIGERSWVWDLIGRKDEESIRRKGKANTRQDLALARRSMKLGTRQLYWIFRSEPLNEFSHQAARCTQFQWFLCLPVEWIAECWLCFSEKRVSTVRAAQQISDASLVALLRNESCLTTAAAQCCLLGSRMGG